MQLYKDFSPTDFDSRGAFGLPGDHLVPGVIQTRDSNCLERSNFKQVGEALTEAGLEFETHRFGHWGPGWFEIYLVTPTDEARELIEELEGRLEDYPVLDEEELSSMEWEEASEAWEHMSVRNRARMLQESRDRCHWLRDGWRTPGGASIFAARRDTLPEDNQGEIMSRLNGN